MNETNDKKESPRIKETNNERKFIGKVKGKVGQVVPPRRDVTPRREALVSRGAKTIDSHFLFAY